MLFSKKEKNKKVEIASKDDGVVVHTMPIGLISNRPVANTKSSPLNAVIFVIIFLLVGGGAFYAFKDYIFPNGLPFGDSKTNNINIIVDDSNINKLPGGSVDNSNMVINTNINENSNVNGFINVVPPKTNTNNTNNINDSNNNNNEINNSGIVPVYIIPHASDRDMDTMPDIEEEIYGTKPGIADTDKDGFWDGQEVINLYDPTIAASSDLRQSSLVKYYNNQTYKYAILYPALWKVIRLGGSDQEITFVSDNKEFVEVAVMDNPNALNAVDWYLAQIPAEQASQTERIWANNFMGIKSLDGLSVYLTPISGDKNFIYSISYMLGSHTNVSFPVTFGMMVRSFDLRD